MIELKNSSDDITELGCTACTSVGMLRLPVSGSRDIVEHISTAPVSLGTGREMCLLVQNQRWEGFLLVPGEVTGQVDELSIWAGASGWDLSHGRRVAADGWTESRKDWGHIISGKNNTKLGCVCHNTE